MLNKPLSVQNVRKRKKKASNSLHDTDQSKHCLVRSSIKTFSPKIIIWLLEKKAKNIKTYFMQSTSFKFKGQHAYIHTLEWPSSSLCFWRVLIFQLVPRDGLLSPDRPVAWKKTFWPCLWSPTFILQMKKQYHSKT